MIDKIAAGTWNPKLKDRLKSAPPGRLPPQPNDGMVMTKLVKWMFGVK